MMTAKLLLVYLLQSTPTVGLDATHTVDIDQAYCLAKNVYFESKGEDIQGQFAVASVTLNRAADPRYPSTVCDVVKQITVSNKTKKRVCQFSWYCEPGKRNEIALQRKDGSVDQRAVDQFQVASMVAIKTLAGAVPDNTRGSTHFHNPYISFPAWRHQLKKTMRVGNHDFYKLPPPRQ